MSTGVCVCACMHPEWEVQGSVLDVYRYVYLSVCVLSGRFRVAVLDVYRYLHACMYAC